MIEKCQFKRRRNLVGIGYKLSSCWEENDKDNSNKNDTDNDNSEGINNGLSLSRDNQM